MCWPESFYVADAAVVHLGDQWRGPTVTTVCIVTKVSELFATSFFTLQQYVSLPYTESCPFYLHSFIRWWGRASMNQWAVSNPSSWLTWHTYVNELRWWLQSWNLLSCAWVNECMYCYICTGTHPKVIATIHCVHSSHSQSTGFNLLDAGNLIGLQHHIIDLWTNHVMEQWTKGISANVPWQVSELFLAKEGHEPCNQLETKGPEVM